jgi:hypothetical protein
MDPALQNSLITALMTQCNEDAFQEESELLLADKDGP